MRGLPKKPAALETTRKWPLLRLIMSGRNALAVQKEANVLTANVLRGRGDHGVA